MGLLPGLPPSLPASVSRLFANATMASEAAAAEEPAVAERERSFYTEQPVLHTAPLRPDMARLVTLLRTHRMKKQVDAPGATIDLDQVL